MRSVALFLSSLVVACGGNIVDIDGGTDSGGNKDVVTTDGGSFSCGKLVCGSNEICIHGCCGGAMICAPLEDGGTCPDGMSITQTCPIDSPCTNICTPPEPVCGSAKDCSMVEGHDCYLLCQ